ncbi:MAG: prephenate dehydrogenase/arogenate dehydrogenase family protein [Fidelibacterota bacterium]
MNSVGLIGLGRFGKVLANILRKGFEVHAYDPVPKSPPSGVESTSLNEVLQEKNVFIAVPIRVFEPVIKEISPLLPVETTILDVCSVKKYPVTVMQTHLPGTAGIIATHPLFGPDSFNYSKHLKMMMNPTRDVHNRFNFWKNYFSSQGIEILIMDPDQHDKQAARTQGVTHFLGRVLKDYGIRRTNLDTQGFRDLLDLVNQTCNDSWELYFDLQGYNPYTEPMIQDLKMSVETMSGKLERKFDPGE